jgi:hypothetical protein
LPISKLKDDPFISIHIHRKFWSLKCFCPEFRATAGSPSEPRTTFCLAEVWEQCNLPPDQLVAQAFPGSTCLFPKKEFPCLDHVPKRSTCCASFWIGLCAI